jgi:hypothetical protein
VFTEELRTALAELVGHCQQGNPHRLDLCTSCDVNLDSLQLSTALIFKIIFRQSACVMWCLPFFYPCPPPTPSSRSPST